MEVWNIHRDILKKVYDQIKMVMERQMVNQMYKPQQWAFAKSILS